MDGPETQGKMLAGMSVIRDGEFLYAFEGKSHPELTGADLVITYTANGSDERLATDMSICFPRFVKIEMPVR